MRGSKNTLSGIVVPNGFVVLSAASLGVGVATATLGTGGRRGGGGAGQFDVHTLKRMAAVVANELTVSSKHRFFYV